MFYIHIVVNCRARGLAEWYW